MRTAFVMLYRILIGFYSKTCDVGVSTLIPVKETFAIDNITNIEAFYCSVDIGVVAAKIRLNGEGVYIAHRILNIEVKVAVLIMASGIVILVIESIA